jgi:hypothetical protein
MIHRFTWLFLLTACSGGTDDPTNDTEAVDTDVTDTDEDAFDPSDPARNDGLWRFVSIETKAGTMTNDSDPGLIGSATFTALGADQMEVDIAMFMLAGEEIDSDDLGVYVAKVDSDGAWIFTNDDGDGVYELTETGDSVTLTALTEDERWTEPLDGEQMLGMSFERYPQAALDFVGSWVVDTMGFNDGTYTMNECIEIGSGHAIVTIDATFDSQLRYTQVMSTQEYDDADCTVAGDLDKDEVEGHADIGSDEMLIWIRRTELEDHEDSDPGMGITFGWERAGDDATLTRTGCIPADECDDPPASLTMHRK